MFKRDRKDGWVIMIFRKILLWVLRLLEFERVTIVDKIYVDNSSFNIIIIVRDSIGKYYAFLRKESTIRWEPIDYVCSDFKIEKKKRIGNMVLYRAYLKHLNISG